MRRITGMTVVAAVALCWTGQGWCDDEPKKDGDKTGEKKDKDKDKDKDKGRRPAPATVEVRVPANAELFFDSAPTRQRGPVRVFITPPLEVGYVYSYDVVARWPGADGKPQKESRKVTVHPGKRSTIEFVAAGGKEDGKEGGKDKSSARDIIDRGIKAAGGEEKLKKFQAATWKQKGTYYGMGDGLPYTGSMAVQWPDKFRMEVDGVFTFVLNGDKGWMKEGGETREMSKEELARARSTNRAEWTTTLLPLKDKAYTLSSLEAVNVDGKPAKGVKVTRKGYPDVKLYFDSKTGLLVKSAFKVYSGEEKKEVKQEVFYQEYRDVDGAQIPNRVVLKRDGKMYVEGEMTDYKVGKVDAKLFNMP